jgi:plastocyanin
MMRHPTRAFTFLAATAVIAGTATACSSGGGSSATTTAPASSAPASTAPASSSPPAPPSPPGQGQTKISIANFTFSPATLTVSPGTQITVTNNDTTTHTLTAVTGKAWDTGDIGVGKTATFTAPAKPGTYQYICTIHPFMKGTLTVR